MGLRVISSTIPFALTHAYSSLLPRGVIRRDQKPFFNALSQCRRVDYAAAFITELGRHLDVCVTDAVPTYMTANPMKDNEVRGTDSLD